MFSPTHFLISRSRKTPVQLIPSSNGFKVLTESEWQLEREPAFEIRARQGFFCQGVPVVGYSIQPIQVSADAETTSRKQTQDELTEPQELKF